MSEYCAHNGIAKPAAGGPGVNNYTPGPPVHFPQILSKKQCSPHSLNTILLNKDILLRHRHNTQMYARASCDHRPTMLTIQGDIDITTV